jgi:hypothetical protein
MTVETVSNTDAICGSESVVVETRPREAQLLWSAKEATAKVVGCTFDPSTTPSPGKCSKRFCG